MKPSRLALLLAALAGVCLATHAADPAAAPSHVPPALFKVSDPELEVTVWATSPLLKNPTNMDTDQQGRIWVAEGANYRSHAKRQPEGGRIMVLQDIDGDGKADKSWVFVRWRGIPIQPDRSAGGHDYFAPTTASAAICLDRSIFSSMAAR